MTVQLVVSRILLVLVASVFMVGICRYRNRVARLLKNFLYQDDSSLNLAVFRIVLCGFVLCFLPASEILRYGQLPAVNMDLPYGMNWVGQVFVFDRGLITVVLVLFYGTGFLSTVGLATRYVLPVYLVCSFYLLTIPQLFGKVNHYHHLTWFLFILCFSACSESLSVDAIRRKGKNWLESVRGSEYGLPLKFCWLLVGVLYFFPGVWKFWEYGFDWVLASDLKFILYHKWDEVGAIPFLRIDRYPWLLGSGALFTLLFELGFVFALFNPYSRLIYVGLGLLFHSFTAVFLFIPFTVLQVPYVMFFNWAGLLREGTLTERLVRWSRLAETRRTGEASAWRNGSIGSSRALVSVGCLLLVATAGFGLAKRTDAWPVACYPTFAGSYPAQVWSIELEYRSRNGPERAGEGEIRRRIGASSERFRARVSGILESRNMKTFERKIISLLRQLERNGVKFPPDSTVEVYSVKKSVRPGRTEGVLERNFVMELPSSRFLPRKEDPSY